MGPLSASGSPLYTKVLHLCCRYADTPFNSRTTLGLNVHVQSPNYSYGNRFLPSSLKPNRIWLVQMWNARWICHELIASVGHLQSFRCSKREKCPEVIWFQLQAWDAGRSALHEFTTHNPVQCAMGNQESTIPNWNHFFFHHYYSLTIKSYNLYHKAWSPISYLPQIVNCTTWRSPAGTKLNRLPGAKPRKGAHLSLSRAEAKQMLVAQGVHLFQ